MSTPTSRHLVTLLLAAGLVFAACGSDDASEPADVPAADDSLPPVDEPVDPNDDAVSTDDDLPLPDQPAVPWDRSDVPADAIGAGNIGGEVVDPQPHPIVGIDIAESFPEQLMVRFSAGDPNCTAATAYAVGSGEEVVVTLVVGIQTDALSKSCLAGDVDHVINVALTEGLNGRTVVTAT